MSPGEWYDFELMNRRNVSENDYIEYRELLFNLAKDYLWDCQKISEGDLCTLLIERNGVQLKFIVVMSYNYEEMIVEIRESPTSEFERIYHIEIFLENDNLVEDKSSVFGGVSYIKDLLGI